jgi:hypothetical protein
VGRNYRYLDNEAGVNKLIPRSFQIVRLVKWRNMMWGINSEHNNCILLFLEETLKAEATWKMQQKLNMILEWALKK